MQIIVASSTVASPLGVSSPHRWEGLSCFAEQDRNEEKGRVLAALFGAGGYGGDGSNSKPNTS